MLGCNMCSKKWYFQVNQKNHDPLNSFSHFH
jgi:hypothetical protein